MSTPHRGGGGRGRRDNFRSGRGGARDDHGSRGGGGGSHGDRGGGGSRGGGVGSRGYGALPGPNSSRKVKEYRMCIWHSPYQ
jgi:hypothetical protein